MLGHAAPSPSWEEPEWLTAIGWLPDDVPFRCCLRLVEPTAGSAWELQMLLQDRQEHGLLYECDQAGYPLEEPYPPEWLNHRQRFLAEKNKWLRILPWLEEVDRTGELRTRLTHDEAWEFLMKGSVELVEAGVTLFLPSWWEQIKKPAYSLRISVKPTSIPSPEAMLGLSAMMQFDWKLAVGDLELDEKAFYRLLEQKQRLIQVRGEWVQVDLALMQRLQTILKRMNAKKGLTFREALEIHLAGGFPLGGAAEGQQTVLSELPAEIEWSEQWSRIVRQLIHIEEIPSIAKPEGFLGQLRPYQLTGSSWLSFLRRLGLGACLADDMGLGKTIQFIAYLLHVKENEHPATPALLICPTSVLGTWQKELQRFAPSLKVHVHYGSRRERGEALLAAIREADVVLTSYTLSHLDETELSSVSWHTLCLDEAQQIKNIYTKQSQAARRLHAAHRIALTGTPVENRLTELWSIADFLNPGYLGSMTQFSRRFISPIEKTHDTERINTLQRLIRPFLLRRVKTDPTILPDLPEKNESNVYVSLTAEQAALYETIIQQMFDRIGRASTMERRGLILASLTRLKQLCNHPILYLKERDTHWQNRSNKLTRLLELIEEVRLKQERCLIFTQFVETGRLLAHVLQQERQDRVSFLHGGVPQGKREQLIRHFQDQTLPAREQSPIFILSLKAGGTGLNLTAANHVFHFDRWWNPAVENQATDRAFRIGQTRNVQVHKFVTLGTMEERIDELISRKTRWSQEVIGNGENWVTELSTAELRELFALRREWID